MLAGEVQTRNLIAGVMLGVVGVMIIAFGMFFVRGVANGTMQMDPDTSWLMLLILPVTGVLFILGGFATAKGSYWFIKILRGLRR